MILSQLRIGARSTTYAALVRIRSESLRLDQPFQNNLIKTDFHCRAFWISMPLIDAVVSDKSHIIVFFSVIMVVFEYFHFYYMMVLKDFHCRLYSAQKFSLLPWWYLKVSIFSTLSYLGHFFKYKTRSDEIIFSIMAHNRRRGWQDIKKK